MRTNWLERGGFWDKGKKQAEKPELPVIREIPVESIRPNPAQPRLSYESGALEELAESIRENGLIQPILVRQLLDGDYELIAGHRRWMAVRKLGQPTIRAIVENRTDTESAVLALVENIQRQDLDYIEEARAISQLLSQWGMSQEQAAKCIGKSQSAVANKLRLLRHSQPVLNALRAGNLTERHARALLKLPDEGAKLSAIAEIVRQNMSVARAEKYIESLCAQSPQTQPKVNLGAFLNSLSQSLARIQSCGIGAVSERRETEDKIVLTITIPKTNRSLQSAENPLK